MSQTALFVAGSLVTLTVFAGGFFYVVFSFGRWADREAAAALTPEWTQV